MKTYRVTVRADRYPTDYVVQASGWHTAIARAIKEWKRKFKGTRTNELAVRAVKIGELLTSDEK